MKAFKSMSDYSFFSIFLFLFCCSMYLSVFEAQRKKSSEVVLLGMGNAGCITCETAIDNFTMVINRNGMIYE